jgi:uncharacterized protein YqgV (UPF0045/DUF77 family)
MRRSRQSREAQPQRGGNLLSASGLASVGGLLDSAKSMDIGVEISLYPLQPQFRGPIHALIERLHSDSSLRVETNSMSTQIFGDYERVMAVLTRELRAALSETQHSACVIKVFGPLGA